MSNLNNIEKMLQFATIEQMYKLLQSMKTDVCNSEENINLNNNAIDIQSINNKITTCSNMIYELNDRVNNIHNKLDTILNYITVVTDTNAKNQILLSSLASELNMNLAQNRLRKLNEKQSSQQLMTDFYAPTSKGSQLSAEIPESANQQLHLEIKEKNTETTEEEVCDDEDNDVNPALITCSLITANVKNEEYDEVVSIDGLEFKVEVKVEKTVTVLDEKPEEDEELSVGEELGDHEEKDLEEIKENNSNQEEELEESEEEVGTDEEVEEELIKEEEKQPVNNHVNEEEEEELELFEIEIDDVTYFATDEENGDLYEMDKDGDVGKKVGIIKDGEPIFN